jgi:hypothetical protein
MGSWFVLNANIFARFLKEKIPIAASEPSSVATTDATAAIISVFSIAAISKSLLSLVNIDAYASREKPPANENVELLENEKITIRAIGA